MTRQEALNYALNAIGLEQELMQDELDCEYEEGEVIAEHKWMFDELFESAKWKKSLEAEATLREMWNEELAKGK